VQCRGCDRWVYKCCSDVKGSLIGDAFVCKVYGTAGDGVDINVQENMDLDTAMYLDRVGKFCYLWDMLSGGVNSASVGRVCCAWGKLSGILTRKDV